MRKFVVPALIGAALLGACVHEARIAMPADVAAQTERIELTGMGGWERGRFRLGASEGRFTRSASQARVDQLLVQNVGGGSFDASGPDFGGALSARCGYHEAEIEAGAIAVPAARLAYGCEFDRDGRHLQGGLLLREVPTSRGVLAGRTRAGELQVGDLTIGIRAIHQMEGGRLPSGTPLGYAFDIGGRQIGAVDLNGTDKTIYAPRAPGPEREAVLMASLALSIFWDPGA